MRPGHGLHGNDFLAEGAARAEQEDEARPAAGGQAAARAAGPAVAGDQ